MNMMITSAQNDRIKEVVKLQKQSAARRHSGLVVVEGRTEAETAVRAGHRPETVFVCPGLAKSRPDWPAGEMVEVDESVFRRMSWREHPDGVIALIKRPDAGLESIIVRDDPWLVVLAGAEKPGNVGAVMRTALAAGADAVIVASGHIDLYNPNAIRASRGAIFGLPVAAAAEAEVIAWLSSRGIRIAAAALDGAVEYSAADLKGPLALVFGTEHEGLGPEWLGAADLKVKIPMQGPLDSLNLSVSAGIIIYEARRQRSK